MNRMVSPISWGPLAVTLALSTAALFSIGCFQNTFLGGGDGGTGGTSMTTSGAGSMGGAGGTGGAGAGATGGSGGAGGTGGAFGGSGGGIECLAPGDCSGGDDACQSRTCVQGQCGNDYAPAGAPLPAQTAGDCKADVCDGSGATIAVIDDADVPDDSNPCTHDVCAAGVPSNPIKPLGTACGMCLLCDANAQCAVADPLHTPLVITTTSPLVDAHAGQAYAVPIEKTCGTSDSLWSINPGGVSSAWLSIDPATGVLFGTPSLADVGPVSVSVHVEEPLLPANHADKTFDFNVQQAVYSTSFEGACPDGWTLSGDWECGVPTNVGPPAAFSGTQCLATQIDALYSNNQTFATATADSPDIDLTGGINPELTFRMWVDTEGLTYDGFNLQISTDGGVSYSVINSVVPAYSLTISGKPAWGGHQDGLGWQLAEADLSAYAGQTVRLRFAFRSDGSSIYPGVYIDDIMIN